MRVGCVVRLIARSSGWALSLVVPSSLIRLMPVRSAASIPAFEYGSSAVGFSAYSR